MSYVMAKPQNRCSKDMGIWPFVCHRKMVSDLSWADLCFLIFRTMWKSRFLNVMEELNFCTSWSDIFSYAMENLCFPRRCNPTTAVFNDPALRGAQDEPAGSLKTAVVGLRVVWGVVVTQVGRGGEGLYALHVFTR